MEEQKKPVVDLITASTVELKAIAYDIFAQLEPLQKNLQLINQELTRRAIIPKPEIKAEVPNAEPTEPKV